MPRRADPELEDKILDAAQKLWKKGGEKALTMRTVARAAGTNTPAVYRRFRDRDDILRGLLQRIRWEIAAQIGGHFFSGGRVRAVSGLCAEPSPGVRTVFPEGV